jgi:hypothetical protein
LRHWTAGSAVAPPFGDVLEEHPALRAALSSSAERLQLQPESDDIWEAAPRFQARGLAGVYVDYTHGKKVMKQLRSEMGSAAPFDTLRCANRM